MNQKLAVCMTGWVILACCFFSASGFAAGEPWADSVQTILNADKSTQTEPSLQFLLDSLGYNIDVANDELGIEVFCGVPGLNTATMTIEVAGSAVLSTSGYYAAGDTSVFYQLFGPANVPGDSVQFTFSVIDSVGFYMKPNLSGNNNTWLTEEDLNNDDFDHAWVFSTGNPHEYLVCFEDLPDGGDADYQDLVFKVRFANSKPEFTFTGSNDVTLCTDDTVCFDITVVDPNCDGDSIWVRMISGAGFFPDDSGEGEVTAEHCFVPTSDGVYEFVFEAEDYSGDITTDTFAITVEVGAAPVVEIPDTTITQCSPQEICLPLSIIDADCDVTSVTTNLGGYSGSVSNFDQVARLTELGAIVTQIGGGDPGKNLIDGADFVGPVNSLSGVSVSLPNFVFAGSVTHTGTFPVGPGLANSSDNMVGAPTDLTFTTPGPGGPDGGAGDGSVDFGSGDRVTLGFGQAITTCNGANVDLIIFTNTAGSGIAELRFYLGGSTVLSVSQSIPGAVTGTGNGGVTVDLADGITFDRVRIRRTGGSFEVDAIAARTLPSPSATDLCFTPDTSGVYTVIATATDGCGNVAADTAYVTVNVNQAPLADAGTDLSVSLCSAAQICLPVSFSDPDNNLATTALIQGTGTLVGSDICFTPAADGMYTFVIKATDSCGLTDRDTVKVTVMLNDPPAAASAPPLVQFQCTPTQLCYAFTATDPNGGPLTWSLLLGPGSITAGGEHCFTPTASGTYTIVAAVTDSCGIADTTSRSYTITLNAAPMAVDPATPVIISQCVPAEVCHQFTASDPDGGTLTWTLLSGDGAVSSTGLYCFTPTGSAAYGAMVAVTDSCGRADTTSIAYNVTVNDPPVIAFGNDTSLALCSPQEICIVYTVDDPQGPNDLVEQMVAGFGSIDTAANEVCFTPNTDGSYEIIVSVTDNCGEIEIDTIVVDVSFGEAALITCPAGPIDAFLCSADSICQMLAITPASATVSVSNGTYTNGTLCFYADTTGTYNVTVIAEESCGADTCVMTFNVDIGETPQITCPPATALFACAPGESLCIPVGVVGADSNVTVSPIGSYNGGTVCFTADTSGTYLLTIIAATSCGADTCTLTADVTVNGNPIAADPGGPIDTFLCASSQICYQFAASDAEGGLLAWTKLGGNGTLSGAGLWCFTANADAAYSMSAVVADSCGAKDTVTLTYNVTLDHKPVLSLGNDTTIFQCTVGQVCLPYTVSDIDNNLQDVSLIQGNGTITLAPAELCFTPAGAGVYQFVATATDSCGKSATDTVLVTIAVNQPPVADAGPDQTIFQCTVAPISWPAGCSDPDGNLVTCELFNGPAGASYDGTNITFTPTITLNYEFVLKATDACGAVDFDTVVVYYTKNAAPVADAGADQTIFQCTPAEICWPVSCTDGDGNLSTCGLVSGPGAYDGTQICFTPTGSGSYEFILEAADACGKTDRDTVVINVTANADPVCQVPNDTSIFQCSPAQVCLPAGGVDADDNLQSCQVNVGSLVNGNWCYTPNASQTVVVTMTCVDSCGAVCQSQFTVEFEVNVAPVVAFGNDTTLFVCDGTEICLAYSADDQNDPRPTTLTFVEGPGSLDTANSQICFTPAADGNYQFVLRIEDECGLFDVDTVNVTVDVNAPPVVNAGPDQNLFVCDANLPVCLPVSCSDPDGNLDTCHFTGPGTYNGSQICFTPVLTGNYIFTLRAIDDCGVQVVDTVTVVVEVNESPLVSLPGDTSIFLCSPAQLCLPYTISDPNGLSGLSEELLTGAGTIDTAANQVCFTPTTSGPYEFIVSVTDSCGVVSADTVTVEVTFGGSATISCPADTIDVFLCDIDSVCQSIAIAPLNATVTVSQGSYANGQLCVYADTTGIYVVDIIADSDCASDTCQVVFSIEIGNPPQITCPSPSAEFVCSPGEQICVPVGVMGGGATVTLPPFASYAGGQVCFNADTTGSYEIPMIAVTTCGADTCLIQVEVTINSNPIADAVSSPVDTAMCAPAQICYQFGATDTDGGPLGWTKLTGNGTLTPTGQWCFTPALSGSYSITAVVADSCGAKDTVNLTYNVTLNVAPIITLGNDTSVFTCDQAQFCFDYTVTDNNAVLEQLLLGMGTLDTAANQVCFTADTMGIYSFVVGVTDACGATDVDTIAVTVAVNRPPVANAGGDNSLFLCNANQVCFGASATDPDGNLSSATVISGAGTYGSGQICFTPDTAGVYVMVLQAIDACGLVDLDTVAITIELNSPPICQIPGDTTIFQCLPVEISLPVSGTDGDGNFDHCELLSGTGSLVSGYWVFTPTVDQTITVKVLCLDVCGASCIDSFTVHIDINDAPVVSAGADTTLFACDAVTVCRDIDITDPNNNLDSVWVSLGSGVYNAGTGQYCLTVPFTEGATKNFTTVIAAVDDCGRIDYDTLKITVNFNSPPTVDVPPDFVAFLEQTGELCFSADIFDVDGNMAAYQVSPIGDYNPATDEICFDADTTGTYCLTVRSWDNCSDTTVDTVCIQVDIDECIHVQIETPPDAIQGQYAEVGIFLAGSGKELGGYNLLIQYDASALTPSTAGLGTIAENCGWEYFQYRLGEEGNCGSGCPSGLIRLVAIADINNGAYHPGCFLDGDVGELASITFFVSNDRTLECQFAPISFFWYDCGDNTMSSRGGDTLWVERNVYNHNLIDITNHNYGFPGPFGMPDECMVGGGPGKPTPLRCIDFTGGGIKIICAEDIDDRGDINLDGLAYTVADAVMFTNYFIYGMSAFGTGPQVQGSIAASDVNIDGITLTVADLVFLIRVVIGDAPPLPKLSPDAVYEASFTLFGGELVITEATDKIGAMYIELIGEVEPSLPEPLTGMEMQYHFDGVNTRVLIYNMKGKSTIAAGPVLTFGDKTRVKSIEIGSIAGIVMKANIETLPDRFGLSQNYPNPFNPTTTIEFSLPVAAEWNLTIYNILGQQVERFGEKSEAGYHKIEWDAGRYASGVYFYRLMAGDYSATKKMILLK
jgi:hypothetical protein